MEKNNWIRELNIKNWGFEIKNWVRYLYSYWFLILFFILAGSFLGYYRASHTQPIYTASLSFVVEEDKGVMSSALGIASVFGIDLGTSGGGAFTSQNLMELMKSRRIIKEVLLSPIIIEKKERTLIDYFIEFNNIKFNKINDTLSKITFPLNLNPNDLNYEQDSIFGKIYETIIDINNPVLKIAQLDKKNNLIYITVSSKSEKFAFFFTKSIANKTAEFYTETKIRKAANNVDILKKQADSIKLELNKAMNKVAIARDFTFNTNPSVNTQRAKITQGQAEVQVNTTILTSIMTNLELANITLRKETPLFQIVDKPELPLKKVTVNIISKTIKYGVIFFVLILIILSLYRIYKIVIIPNI